MNKIAKSRGLFFSPFRRACGAFPHEASWNARVCDLT